MDDIPPIDCGVAELGDASSGVIGFILSGQSRHASGSHCAKSVAVITHDIGFTLFSCFVDVLHIMCR